MDVLAPDVEYDPAGHHPEAAVNPLSAQYFPGSHDLQMKVSAALWYVPDGHGEHVDGSAVQYEPAGHVRGPEVIPVEGAASDDVCTMMPPATLAPLLPMVNPLIVIVNDDSELIEALDIVMTTAVIEVALHAAARPETLLPPAATVGIINGAKKFEG